MSREPCPDCGGYHDDLLHDGEAVGVEVHFYDGGAFALGCHGSTAEPSPAQNYMVLTAVGMLVVALNLDDVRPAEDEPLHMHVEHARDLLARLRAQVLEGDGPAVEA